MEKSTLKKLLVPIDFSEHSEYALEVAAFLAQDSAAEILLLHMLGLSDGFMAGDEADERAEADYYLNLARGRFRPLLEKPYLKGLEVSVIIQNHKNFGEINEVAREKEADLIIMGSHGAGGMKEIFVGSNTEKVVRSSEQPVLVIKKRMSGINIQKVVFAIEFRKEFVKAYQKALDFFKHWPIELHLVHVNLPNLQFLSTTQLQEMSQQFLELAHQGPPPAHVKLNFVSDYSVEKGLYAYAGRIRADLIAVTTHGRSGISHFFRGSVGEDISNHAPLPVMTFKV